MSQAQSTESITQDHELDVLAQLHQNTGVKQRDLAQAIGLSLGMTNAILKRLAGKGFVAMRRINARNIHYLVTPEGIDLIARRSYRYLRRTVGHVVRYKERLTEVLGEAAENDHFSGVLLIGETDLEFLVEWCAEKAGLAFRRAAALPKATAAAHTPELINEFIIAGEAVPRLAPAQTEPWNLHLADLVVQGRRVSS